MWLKPFIGTCSVWSVSDAELPQCIYKQLLSGSHVCCPAAAGPTAPHGRQKSTAYSPAHAARQPAACSIQSSIRPCRKWNNRKCFLSLKVHQKQRACGAAPSFRTGHRQPRIPCCQTSGLPWGERRSNFHSRCGCNCPTGWRTRAPAWAPWS